MPIKFLTKACRSGIQDMMWHKVSIFSVDYFLYLYEGGGRADLNNHDLSDLPLFNKFLFYVNKGYFFLFSGFLFSSPDYYCQLCTVSV